SLDQGRSHVAEPPRRAHRGPGSGCTSTTPSTPGRSASTHPTGPRPGASNRGCSVATAIVAPEGHGDHETRARGPTGVDTSTLRTQATTVSRSSSAPEPRVEPVGRRCAKRLRGEAVPERRPGAYPLRNIRSAEFLTKRESGGKGNDDHKEGNRN